MHEKGKIGFKKKAGSCRQQNRKKKDLYKGELNPAKDHNTRDISFIFGIKTPHFRRPALQKAPTRKFHSYFFKYHILSITCTEIFTCLDIFSVIFCFTVILGDNFSFPGQPIDWNLKETQNIDLNLQFRFQGRRSTCEVLSKYGKWHIFL